MHAATSRAHPARWQPPPASARAAPALTRKGRAASSRSLTRKHSKPPAPSRAVAPPPPRCAQNLCRRGAGRHLLPVSPLHCRCLRHVCAAHRCLLAQRCDRAAR
eukprot:6020690-Prymnesium_polylepis.1